MPFLRPFKDCFMGLVLTPFLRPCVGAPILLLRPDQGSFKGSYPYMARSPFLRFLILFLRVPILFKADLKGPYVSLKKTALGLLSFLLRPLEGSFKGCYPFLWLFKGFLLF